MYLQVPMDQIAAAYHLHDITPEDVQQSPKKKENQKNKEQQQPKKKEPQVKKSDKPKKVEDAAKNVGTCLAACYLHARGAQGIRQIDSLFFQVNSKELQSIIDNITTLYPDNHILWFKDVATYLNKVLSAENPVSLDKPFSNYPLSLLTKVM